jgi:protein-arginine kinase activator protein McsA
MTREWLDCLWQPVTTWWIAKEESGILPITSYCPMHYSNSAEAGQFGCANWSQTHCHIIIYPYKYVIMCKYLIISYNMSPI